MSFFWPRGSTGVQRYGYIPQSAANNSGEIPQNWELQIPCFEEFFWGGNTLGTRPCQFSLTLWDTPVLFTPPLPLHPVFKTRVFAHQRLGFSSKQPGMVVQSMPCWLSQQKAAKSSWHSSQPIATRMGHGQTVHIPNHICHLWFRTRINQWIRKHTNNFFTGLSQDYPGTIPVFSWDFLGLWSQRAPNSTETQKDLKWPQSDSKVTRADRPQSDPKLTQKWLWTPCLSHFWVTFESLGVTLGWRPWKSFFESLLGHFNSFWVSVELGARWLLNPRDFVYVFPSFPTKKTAHRQIWPPPIPGIIPKSCLCVLVVFLPISFPRLSQRFTLIATNHD